MRGLKRPSEKKVLHGEKRRETNCPYYRVNYHQHKAYPCWKPAPEEGLQGARVRIQPGGHLASSGPFSRVLIKQEQCICICICIYTEYRVQRRIEEKKKKEQEEN